jgi:hypothetical protein
VPDVCRQALMGGANVLTLGADGRCQSCVAKVPTSLSSYSMYHFSFSRLIGNYKLFCAKRLECETPVSLSLDKSKRKRLSHS